MTKQITFTAKNKQDFELQPRPIPTASLLPSWWRKATPYYPTPDNKDGKKFILDPQVGRANTTFKKCVPMLDALTTGYLITLWADVIVTINDQGFSDIGWRTTRPVFEVHGLTARDIPPPLGYTNQVFKYINTWQPKTPKGFSIIVHEPFGYTNSPFRAIPAVLDTDRLFSELAPPVWIQEGFEGVVEKGTPIAQITPFKRTDWKADFDYLEDGEWNLRLDKHFNSTMMSHYIKNSLTKKTYK